MDEINQEEKCDACGRGGSALPWMAGIAIFGLIAGVLLGREYQEKKDRPATDLTKEIIRTVDGMKSIEFPKETRQLIIGKLSDEGGLIQRWHIGDDDAGIAYLEVHFIPRWSLGKFTNPDANLERVGDDNHPTVDVQHKHKDVGDPEKDGKVPSEEADKWATQGSDPSAK